MFRINFSGHVRTSSVNAYAISWPHTDPHVMRTMPAHLTNTSPMIQQMLALVPNVCRIYTACTRAKRTCILAVVQILFLKFPTQLLHFSIFSKFCFKTLCGILFPIFPQKFILFIMFFYKFGNMKFYFSNCLYRSFAFENICIIKLVWIILCVYILYMIFYLNKLHNFQFSLSNCDLDLTWYS